MTTGTRSARSEVNELENLDYNDRVISRDVQVEEVKTLRVEVANEMDALSAGN